MNIKDPKDLFVKFLSDIRQHEIGLTDSISTLRENIQDQDTKEYFESLTYLNEKNIETINLCFKMIGKEPIKTDDSFRKIFLEDFQKGFKEIESPIAKILYITVKVNHLMNARSGEWISLIAMSDISGHRGISLLLESVFKQKVAFSERVRSKIQHIIEAETV